MGTVWSYVYIPVNVWVNFLAISFCMNCHHSHQHLYLALLVIDSPRASNFRLLLVVAELLVAFSLGLINSYFTWAKGHTLLSFGNIPAPRCCLYIHPGTYFDYHIPYHSRLFLSRPDYILDQSPTHEKEGRAREGGASFSRRTSPPYVFWQHYGRPALTNVSGRLAGEHWQLLPRLFSLILLTWWFKKRCFEYLFSFQSLHFHCFCYWRTHFWYSIRRGIIESFPINDNREL